jgi:hypothetical protein
MPDPNREALRRKLNLETARLSWRELQPHFARGVVVVVSAELDLVDVAAATAGNDSQAVKSWHDGGLMALASDDDARRWHRNDPELWAVVVAPWVLVQEARSP